MGSGRSLVIVAAVVLASVLAACSRHRAEPPGPLDNASPAVAAAMAAQESLLAVPMPVAPEAPRVERYLHLNNRLADPEERVAARESLFRAWAADPTDPLLIELAGMNGGVLGRKALQDSLFAVAAGPDSTAAMARFVVGRRAWGTDAAVAGRAYRDARDRAEPGTLLAVWAGFRAGRILADEGQTEKGVGELAASVVPAWRLGGPALAALVWSDLSRVTRQAQHLDDALAGARMAAACADAQPDGYLQVRTRLSLALAHRERGRARQAMALLEDAYATARDSGYVRLRSVATGLMAITAHATGDLDREVAALEHMEALTAAAADTNGLLRAGLALADAYRRQGRTQDATDLLDRLTWINGAWSDRDMTRTIGRVRALIYNQEGHYAAAESLYNLAASGDELGGIAGAITTQVNLVNQALETRRPSLAYAALARARRLQASNPVAARQSSASLHLELAAARLYANQGEYELAAAAMDSAAAQARRLDRQAEWFVQDTAGECARLAGDAVTATERFSAALAVADSLGVPDRIQRSRINLASVLLERGRWQDAADLVHDELDVRSYWPRLHARLVNAMALARAGDHEEARAAFAAARTALGNDPPADLAARLLVERARNELALGHPRSAFALVDSARTRLDGAGDLNSDLGRTFRRGIRREVAELTVDLLSDHAAVLGVRDPVAAGRDIVAWVRHEQPTSATGPRIEYFVGDGRTFAWATGGAGRPWRWKELGPTADLRTLADAVTTDMAYPDREVDWAAAARLGALLYGPVLDDWPAGAVLDVAPDRFLARLPWSALPCAAGGSPAIDRGPLVIVVGSPRMPAVDSGAGRLLAIGDDGTPGPGHVVLAEAEDEARAVAQVWRGGEVDLRLGAQGHLDRLLDRGLRGYRAVHLSTHAEIYQGAEGEATVRLGNRQEVPLTVDRIATARVDAQLVYLSNCEGARRYRSRGRGVISFAEAFLDAGAGRVVASSLVVEDATARTLAESFYRHWLAGSDAAAALRAAVLELRDRHPDRTHPFYWGFIGLYERPAA